MSKKYINADALISDIKQMRNTSNGYSDTFDKSEIIGVIEEQPVANVRENVRGEWEIMEDADGCTYYRCSACHRYRFHNGAMLKKYRFCPNCGADNRPRTTSADMRGEEYE